MKFWNILEQNLLIHPLPEKLRHEGEDESR
jgi:hypothetical protein